MPWGNKTVEEQRKEFVNASKVYRNMSAICREFGITRKTGYKWIERSKEKEELSDRSHARKTITNKTSEAVERLILEVRSENPAWGGKTIRKVLANEGHANLPCAKTVSNVLKRNGCISEQESLKHTAYVRYEKERCNQMWQTDFKGDFRLMDGTRCYPLDILDDHSRFAIKVEAKADTRGITVHFKEAFCEYGVPESVLSDNGAQFAGFKQGYTQFEKWMMNHDVLPIHGRIHHPQTQGKIERFHRTMKEELLKYNQFENIADVSEKLMQWREKYNNIRPHEALGLKCPAQVYTPSSRVYSDEVESFEYGGQHHIIKVNSWGYVRFDKWQVYLSETMRGEYIEFRPGEDGESFFACYRNFKIAEFSTQDGSRLNRKISRL